MEMIAGVLMGALGGLIILWMMVSSRSDWAAGFVLGGLYGALCGFIAYRSMAEGYNFSLILVAVIIASALVGAVASLMG